MRVSAGNFNQRMRCSKDIAVFVPLPELRWKNLPQAVRLEAPCCVREADNGLCRSPRTEPRLEHAHRHLSSAHVGFMPRISADRAAAAQLLQMLTVAEELLRLDLPGISFCGTEHNRT